jgi:hypothetical protein
MSSRTPHQLIRNNEVLPYITLVHVEILLHTRFHGDGWILHKNVVLLIFLVLDMLCIKIL